METHTVVRLSILVQKHTLAILKYSCHTRTSAHPGLALSHLSALSVDRHVCTQNVIFVPDKLYCEKLRALISRKIV